MVPPRQSERVFGYYIGVEYCTPGADDQEGENRWTPGVLVTAPGM